MIVALNLLTPFPKPNQDTQSNHNPQTTMQTTSPRSFAALTLASLLISAASVSAITIPSDGSDGAFAPAASVVVDLSQAATGAWNTPGTGNGVYDPAQWAVVFKYSSVNIPSGVTVTFTNHPSRAPVIWLVQGAVTINGTVALNGQTGHAGNVLRSFAEPGAGGFRGGRGADAQTLGAGGMGPGGASYGAIANHAGSGGGYGTEGGLGANGGGAVGIAYGNAGVFPLLGGSGGAGSADGANGKGGGSGGGAILIATPGTITLNGQVQANGGAGTAAGGGNRASGGGAGGGIRLIAEQIAGTGMLRALGGAGGSAPGFAVGGNGGVGRIRLETFSNTLTDLGNPAYSMGTPEETPRIFRDPATPAIRAVTLNGQNVPEDPRGEMSFPNTDVTLPQPGTATLVIQAANVPLDGEVIVRVVLRSGVTETYNAALTDGTVESSTWTAQVNIAGGYSTVQVHAKFPAED